MIKVHKDLDDIPSSLFDRKTEKRRNNCIRDKKYHQKKEFHQRFKQSDIKEALQSIYHEKCAFCESKVEECTNNNLEECSSTVEHYRPKSKYYWLAFSWDNLLWCCHRCNQNKENKFEISKAEVEYSENFLNNIHNSSENYQIIENPKMIHPELESVLEKLNFEKSGKINSNDERVKYTITTCDLNRDTLTENRKVVIDIFQKRVKAKLLNNEPYQDVLVNLLNEIKEKKSEFIALRYWILKNHKTLVEDN